MATSSDTTPREYGSYISTIYQEALLHNRLPVLTTDPNRLEAEAQKVLRPTSFNYVAGGAGEKATMDANRLAFRQWKLIPRMLRPIPKRDLSIKLFGKTYDSPILMAPVGVQGIFHTDRELGLAEVCASIGVPFIMSTAATSSIEEVAAASGPNSPRWYQLYWPQSHDLTASILKRAKENGFTTLVVTLDTYAMPWRPADLDKAYLPFLTGVGDRVAFTDPVFKEKFAKKYGGAKPEDMVPQASVEWLQEAFSGVSHSWEDIAFLKEQWEGPIVLKGIQSVEDAKLAVKAGVDGIVVSNHGGRQLDGAIASLEVLPEIAEAVGSQITVLFDSGIRTGSDIIKALALGAKAVLIGRPAIYGLAIGGKQGAKQVLQGLLADLDQGMNLSGTKDIAGCNRSLLRKVQYGGDVKSST